MRVDHELDHGDLIDFGGGARTVAVPGHTAGSIALYLPQPGVLFTGDIMARDPQTSTDADRCRALARLDESAIMTVRPS